MLLLGNKRKHSIPPYFLSFFLPPDDDHPVIDSLDDDARTGGSPDLGLTANFLQNFGKDVMALADVVNETRIAQETEEAEAHEKKPRQSGDLHYDTYLTRRYAATRGRT